MQPHSNVYHAYKTDCIIQYQASVNVLHNCLMIMVLLALDAHNLMYIIKLVINAYHARVATTSLQIVMHVLYVHLLPLLQ